MPGPSITISCIFHFKKHDIAACSHMPRQKHERIKPCLISRVEWVSFDPSSSWAVSADFPLPVSAPLPAPPHPVFWAIVLTRFLPWAAAASWHPRACGLGTALQKQLLAQAGNILKVSLEASQGDLLQASPKLTLSAVKDPAPFRSLPGLCGITCGC